MDPTESFLECHLHDIEALLDSWGFSNPASDLRAKKKAEILSWFRNFSPSELPDALLLLSKIQYISDHLIREAISSLAQEISNLLGDTLQRSAFFPLGTSPSSSGGMYLYEYRKALNLLEHNFPNRSISEASDEYDVLIFFEDIIGSGSQASRFYEQ